MPQGWFSFNVKQKDATKLQICRALCSPLSLSQNRLSVKWRLGNSASFSKDKINQHLISKCCLPSPMPSDSGWKQHWGNSEDWILNTIITLPRKGGHADELKTDEQAANLNRCEKSKWAKSRRWEIYTSKEAKLLTELIPGDFFFFRK